MGRFLIFREFEGLTPPPGKVLWDPYPVITSIANRHVHNLPPITPWNVPRCNYSLNTNLTNNFPVIITKNVPLLLWLMYNPKQFESNFKTIHGIN